MPKRQFGAQNNDDYLEHKAEQVQLEGHQASNPASVVVIDFSGVEDNTQGPVGFLGAPGEDRPLSPDGLVMSDKQIRARLRRKRKRYTEAFQPTPHEVERLYKKPVSEWDMEELARGRPRNKSGTFSGPKPKWISGEVHEEAANRLKVLAKGRMSEITVNALEVISNLLSNEEYDEKGKPVVAPSVKLDASKFLVEHLIGKPKQHIEQDVSIKLQGILAQVMVNPTEANMDNYQPAHMPGMTMELSAGPTYDENGNVVYDANE